MPWPLIYDSYITSGYLSTVKLNQIGWLNVGILSTNAVVPLILMMALLLAASLCGLAASGHFPRERRSPSLGSRTGSLILFGSLVLSMISLAVGVTIACRVVPWYAAVIGGGAMVLATPLVLQPLPDRFVDGPGALITFAGASVAIALLLALTPEAA